MKTVVTNDEWNIDTLHEAIYGEMTKLIVHSIKPARGEEIYKARWTDSNTGLFTSKSAYQIIRSKRQNVKVCKYIWCKGIPNKVPFFLWRTLKERISTDDNLKRIWIPIVSKWIPMSYLFLTVPLAQRLCKHFASCVGFKVEGRTCRYFLEDGGIRWILQSLK